MYVNAHVKNTVESPRAENGLSDTTRCPHMVFVGTDKGQALAKQSHVGPGSHTGLGGQGWVLPVLAISPGFYFPLAFLWRGTVCPRRQRGSG